MTNSDGAGPVPWRQSPRRRAIAAAAVLVAAAALSAVSLLAVHWAAGSSARAQTPGNSGLGFVALDRPTRGLSLPSLRGRGTIDLAGLAGKPIVMNFWSSHCYPCKQETPALARAARALGGKVTFVGIDTADVRDKAVAFVDRYKVPYLLAFDPNATAADRYGITGLPMTVFLSPSAKTIVGENVGVLTSAKLYAILRRLYGVS
jgi:thiol-disulfide isomerase/thioredoxin